MKDLIQHELDEHLKTTQQMGDLIDQLERAAKICIQCLKNGGKILIFGNGGSAADAQHIAAELVGRYKIERKGLPAIALTTDSSALTCISNDYDYGYVFSRQVEALSRQGDVAIGISTGGTSTNVLNGLKTANEHHCKTIGFSGRGGGTFQTICDINLVVPAEDTPRIQEMHIFIGHTLCHLIDQEFKGQTV